MPVKRLGRSRDEWALKTCWTPSSGSSVLENDFETALRFCREPSRMLDCVQGTSPSIQPGAFCDTKTAIGIRDEFNSLVNIKFLAFLARMR
jgi:hypothetical protein